MTQPFADPCGRGVINAEPDLRQRIVEPSGRRRIVLAACVLASSMVFIDGSVLTVALPELRAALSADLATVQWVVNSYVLALAALTLIGGALADAQGRARMLSIGCLLFGATSAACALSPSAGWLIASRVVQGTSAALLTPASLALIGATFPKGERTGAIGVWAAASALTSAAGPVVGGWLTDRFGWQAIFWINPPIALVAVALLRISVTADPRLPRRFDVGGAGLIACALGAVTWTLSEIGRGRAADAQSIGAVVLVGALGLAGLGAYAAWEQVSPHPMTPPRLADNRIFVGLNAATLLLYSGLSIMFFLLPFELVDRRHLSPTAAGLAFLPFTLGVGLLSRFFGGLADQFGAPLLLIAGAAGASVAYVWMALAAHGPLVAAVIAPQALLGISFAVLVAPLTGSVMSSVAKSDEGLASGINNAASRIAQLAGVALAAAFGTVDAGYRYGLWLAAVVSVAAAVTTSVELPPLPKKKQRRS